jgi:hypothetical protein
MSVALVVSPLVGRDKTTGPRKTCIFGKHQLTAIFNVNEAENLLLGVTTTSVGYWIFK